MVQTGRARYGRVILGLDPDRQSLRSDQKSNIDSVSVPSLERVSQ